MMNNGDSRQAIPPQKNMRDYKLLLDPCLQKGGGVKLYRYDGMTDATYPMVIPSDPRNRNARMRSRLEPLDIPVPR